MVVTEKTFVERVGKLLDIDLSQLEKEWVEQPYLFFNFDVDLTEAEAEVERAKANLELVDAELAKKVRRHPKEYGLEKVSEAGVSSVIVTLAEHMDAVEALITAKYQAGVRRAAVRSCEHRKKALEKSVDLLLAGLFSAPRPPPEAREELVTAARRSVRNGNPARRGKTSKGGEN